MIMIEIKYTVNVSTRIILNLSPPAYLVHGKEIVFHETSPWCQKGLGPLTYRAPGLGSFFRPDPRGRLGILGER